MGFKNFRSSDALNEAFKNIENDYAIFEETSISLENDLKEKAVTFYKAKVQVYESKTTIAVQEGIVVLNKDLDDFRKVMIDLAEKYNHNSIRIYAEKNELISTAVNEESYPGFGKTGVIVELKDKMFSESGEVINLPTDTGSVQDGFGIIFPTENSFY